MNSIRKRREQVEFVYATLIGLLTIVSMILIKALTDAETECYIALCMIMVVPGMLLFGNVIIDMYYTHLIKLIKEYKELD